ncbi:MAG: hypothetical protein AAGI03_01435 [Pseudomonadota bacterium]
MTEISIYITAYTDETMPCEASLEGWAEWLSKPDPDWRRPEPAKDGEVFKATVTDIVEVVASIDEAGNLHCTPDLPADYDYLVPRYGSGQGWDADDFCFDEAGLEEHVKWYGNGIYVAVLKDRSAPYSVIYHAAQDDQSAWCELKEGVADG